MRLWAKSIIFWMMRGSGFFYITPATFNYWYNFGVLAFFFLLIQIVSGLFLAMHYDPQLDLAHASVVYINNEVYFGWWVRAIHANGASWFFFVVYVHMFRGLYMGSYAYPRHLLWISGIVIYLLMVLTAFCGYILPWGQMSFWAAIVLTTLLTAIPVVGNDIVFMLWGGYTMGDASLHRFYCLHFVLPFVIFAIVQLHLLFLHEFGSSNPTGLTITSDNIPFLPYYGVKDTAILVFVLSYFFFLIFLYPDLFGHPDNYIMASLFITPPHIVPEWYFWPLYAVLRSVDDKLTGIFLVLCFFGVLLLLPYLTKNPLIKGTPYKPLHGLFFWLFFLDCIFLGWIGGLTTVTPFDIVGKFLVFFYFFFLLLPFPLINLVEKIVYDVYIIEHKVNEKWTDSRFFSFTVLK